MDVKSYTDDALMLRYLFLKDLQKDMGFAFGLTPGMDDAVAAASRPFAAALQAIRFEVLRRMARNELGT
jgi:hypothetical protein